jgi:hypothetical protein
MATLDRWRRYLNTPLTIAFPSMTMMGRDRKLGNGRGEVKLASSENFTFLMNAHLLDDLERITDEITALRKAPQDPTGHPRVTGLDAEGVRWSCHYMAPWCYTAHGNRLFGGTIVSLVTKDQSETVSHDCSTELILSLGGANWLAMGIANAVQADQPGGELRRDYELEILGSKIRFVLEPDANTLSITATHSSEFPSVYSESWLVQPLRIMFGELIYPRLIARNVGDGTAFVFITRSSDFVRDAYWATLWDRDYVNQPNSAFWSRYSQLLYLIAREKGKDGKPEVAPKITRIYEELIEAGRGTHWVWALTFASTIEAIATILAPQEIELTKAEAEEMDALVKHINAWKGEGRLKENAVRAVRRTAEMTTIKALRKLRSESIITKEQLDAWQTTRNSVMHGTLLSPYSTEKENERLNALAAMMHAMTREVIRRAVSESIIKEVSATSVR